MTSEDLGTTGFARGTDRYERARPSYPPDAVEHLCTAAGIGPGTRVLDLAAGTGKLTGLLVERGATVTAVEPSEAMRATFARVIEGVPVHPGSAERIPAPAEAYDVVTVAQAFHWFDREPALREIARVLRPGGVLAMVWNEMDESEEFIARLAEVVRWPFHKLYDHRPDLDAGGRFEPAERRVFRWRDALTHDRLVERCSTFSYVATMAAGPKAELLSGISEFVRPHAEPVELAYLCDTYIARRRADAP